MTTTTKPIDIRAIAGNRWQIEWDESRFRHEQDPWLLVIPCARGHIYRHSDTLLGVATDSRSAGQALAKLPGVSVTQEADDGFNLVFGPKLLPKVAKIVKPKRRRQLSAVQRELVGARMAQYAFKPARQSGILSAGTTLLGSDVSLAV